MLNHLIEALTSLITNLYVSTGLVGIIVAMAIESCCIPLPSEIVMPLAGVMLAQGRLLPGLNPWLALLLVALSGSLGCLIGSMLAYAIGASGGRPLMLKYGRYVLISQHDADKADEFFRRWGSATTFFSRLLPVVRTYISLPAGITKMPFGRFCLYTFLGSLPWCLALAYAGTVLGNHLDMLAPIFHSLDGVIVLALLVLVALYIWRHIRHDRRARAAHAAASAQQQQRPGSAEQPWSSTAQQTAPWGQPMAQQPQAAPPWSNSSVAPSVPSSQFAPPSQLPWQTPPLQGQLWGGQGYRSHWPAEDQTGSAGPQPRQ
ncbi:DedA family protein [Thermogemmatispora sp.]|uniref:DedA family protein n=1 Tax=Thermogemmatispora sp. TaxID=1968838 RepID=UPI001DA52C1D|nr:DedA family protein [Thermogemmatispora sp.]MBX5449876.1 DedA family protein [Thermogemmatispora sp.]